MTTHEKPTAEQVAALKEGDVVWVRAEAYTNGLDGDGEFQFNVLNRGERSWCCCDPSEIVAIEPREIQVGDRVRWAVEGFGPDLGWVKYVHGKTAAVLFDGGTLHICRTNNLTVIPQ